MMDYAYIDRLLFEKRMSRRQLAKEAGINAETLSTWFKRNKRNVDRESMVKIASALGVPVTSLETASEQIERLEAKNEREQQSIASLHSALQSIQLDKSVFISIDKLLEDSLLASYRKLTPEQKNVIMNLVFSMVRENEKDESPCPEDEKKTDQEQ